MLPRKSCFPYLTVGMCRAPPGIFVVGGTWWQDISIQDSDLLRESKLVILIPYVFMRPMYENSWRVFLVGIFISALYVY